MEPRLDASEERRRLEAYELESSDVAAARRIGISGLTFNRWRRARGLAPKGPRRRRLNAFEEQRRRAVYKTARNDADAARTLNIHHAAFAAWRHQRALPAKQKRGSWGAPRAHRDEPARRAAYEATQSDTDAARQLGIKPITFTMWRRRQGLTNKYQRRLTADEDTRRREAYDAGLSDDATARKLGIDRKSYEAWRKSRGLPSRGLKPRKLRATETRRRLDTWLKMANDADAAEALGLTLHAWRKWRHNSALPPPSARPDATMRTVLSRLSVGTRRAWALSQRVTEGATSTNRVAASLMSGSPTAFSPQGMPGDGHQTDLAAVRALVRDAPGPRQALSSHPPTRASRRGI